MARRIREKEIIRDNIQNYIEASTKDYSTYLGVPTFVTYYTKNVLTSTQDVGLENVHEIAGSESPIKWNKIENLPIYGISELSNSLENTDYGVSASIEGEGTLVPNSIKPLTNDIFYIDYNSKNYVFRVKDIETDKMNGNRFYKIQFELTTTDSIEYIEDGNIERELTANINDLGDKSRLILTKDEDIVLHDIELIETRLIDYYKTYFIDKSNNYPMFKNSDNTFIYDAFLCKFIQDNNILHTDRYLDTYNIPYIRDFNLYDINLYDNSIYTVISTLITDDLTTNYFILKSDTKDTPFEYDYRVLNEMRYIDLTVKNELVDEALTEDLLNKIINNILYESYFYENILIKYINKQYPDIKSLYLDLEVLKVSYKYFKCNPYIIIPLIIYIIKTEKGKLLKKKDEVK